MARSPQVEAETQIANYSDSALMLLQGNNRLLVAGPMLVVPFPPPFTLTNAQGSLSITETEPDCRISVYSTPTGLSYAFEKRSMTDWFLTGFRMGCIIGATLLMYSLLKIGLKSTSSWDT